ncbi:MAG: hypothetical protein ABI887_06775 [Burkholderiales bacterium]
MPSIIRASSAFIASLGLPGSPALMDGRSNTALTGATFPVVANAGLQNATAVNANGGSWPVATLLLQIRLMSGKVITTNSDFVMLASPDLASELIASGGWSAYVPAGGYALPIPFSA